MKKSIIPSFNWMPAATNTGNFGSLGIYVKHHRLNNKRFSIKSFNSSHWWFDTPDREILIIGDSNFDTTFYPFGEKFDQFYNLNILDERISHDLGFKYLMPNFVHDASDYFSLLRKNRTHHPKTFLLSDSGGFQLLTGVTDTINPLEIAAWYNTNIDLGMVLDVPLLVSDMDLVERSARMQVRNNNILLANCKDVELINIIHGTSAAQRRRFREIVETDKIKRISIGGAQSIPFISLVDYFWELVNTGQKYKQYHFLGISTIRHMPIFVLLAHATKTHITSDSSSHKQSAISHQYYVFLNNGYTSNYIGGKDNYPNVNRFLPCNCPVCSAVKYSDILSYFPGQIGASLIGLHNALVVNRYASLLNAACANLSRDEYISFVKSLFKGSRLEYRDVIDALHFIQIAENDGIKVAQHKYRSAISQVKIRSHLTDGLFGNKSATNKSESKVAALLTNLEKQATAIESGKLTLVPKKKIQKSKMTRIW